MSNLKAFVRGAYDIQELRIQMGNRIVSNMKVKLGQAPGEAEKDMDAKGKLILTNLRLAYKTMMEAAIAFPRRKDFKANEVISDYTELCLVQSYMSKEREEKEHFKMLKNILEDYKIYTDYLKDVNGIGPAMAGIIISEIDITVAKYPSSLWKYAGLDVGPDAKGRSRKKEHLVESEYTTADGEIKTKMGITFNPFLKTKLVGVLGGGFLKVKESPYKDIYYNYKTRLENHVDHQEKTKGHRHNMATRYMIKMFLIDLHREWRMMEGFEESTPYSEGKLGRVHLKS